MANVATKAHRKHCKVAQTCKHCDAAKASCNKQSPTAAFSALALEERVSRTPVRGSQATSAPIAELSIPCMPLHRDDCGRPARVVVRSRDASRRLQRRLVVTYLLLLIVDGDSLHLVHCCCEHSEQLQKIWTTRSRCSLHVPWLVL